MPPKGEIGRVGQRRFQGVFFEEFIKDLHGHKGIETYKEMSENDDVIGAILFAIEMLMRQCEFRIDPAGETEADEKAAKFVEECLYDMEDTWTDTLSEILSFLTYGWSYHEIVYKRRNGKTRDKRTTSKYDDGLIGWRKLPLRAQETLYQWEYEDNTDDLIGMTQAPPPDYGNLTIPIEKALHFRTRSRKANPEGRSILRNAYRAWFFKKRIQEIEGIGMERDLAGFPVLTGPEELDLWDQDNLEAATMLATAESIVTSIRRDAREGLVMPYGWKLELLSAGNRRQFDTNQIIERYDKRIATTVLADFVLLGQEGVGSFALSSDKTRLFSVAIGTYLDIICEVFNNQGIPRLIELNSEHFKGITDYPEMHHGDIEEEDIQKLGTFIKDMVGIGALMPDEDLEEFIREKGNLPKKVEGVDPYPAQQPQQAQPGQPGQNPAPQNPAGQNLTPGSQKTAPGDDEALTPEEQDAKDLKDAQEAKKSLGRRISDALFSTER